MDAKSIVKATSILLFVFITGCASVDPSKDITTIRIFSDRITRLEDTTKAQETKLKELEFEIMKIKAMGPEDITKEIKSPFTPRFELPEKDSNNGLTNREREFILLLLNNYRR